MKPCSQNIEQIHEHNQSIKISMFQANTGSIFCSAKYLLGNPPGTSPHFEDGTQGKPNFEEAQDFTTKAHLRVQHVTCRN